MEYGVGPMVGGRVGEWAEGEWVGGLDLPLAKRLPPCHKLIVPYSPYRLREVKVWGPKRLSWPLVRRLMTSFWVFNSFFSSI